jgi:hypothetical protein
MSTARTPEVREAAMGRIREHGMVSGLAWAASLATLTWAGLGLTGAHGLSRDDAEHLAAAVHDTTPPTGLRLEGGPNPDGWYSAPAEYRWTAEDRDSGIVWCQKGSVVTIDTDVLRRVTGTCVNGVGAAAHAGFSYRYDGTPPTLDPVAEPAVVAPRRVVVAVPRARDALSGVAGQSCNGNHVLNTRRPGMHRVRCVARDRAGNLGTATVTYWVVGARGRKD